MTEHVAYSGSCTRCRRALGLASVKVDGSWYGTATCAEGVDCPLDREGAPEHEIALAAVPRRFFGRRAPKELQRKTKGS